MSQPDARILIVDDEFSVRDSLKYWFEKDGFTVGTAEDALKAQARLDAEEWDVILLDIRMPGMDGLELQRRILAADPDAAIIMITAFASVDSAVRALKQGAVDYITKPIDPDVLGVQVRKALERRRLATENKRLKATLQETLRIDEIVGDSLPIRQLLQLVRSVAPTDATVLVRGESGTGKELVAQAIHAHSRRRYFPIVPVNCGSLAEGLLESELFGHVKGAFTGAHFARKGRLAMADGGTLFLDEVGTVSPRMQVELLRVLETHEFTPVGSQRTVSSDFRLVSATNQDLEAMVKAGTFREDLYYRLNVFTLELPPLRERRSDIPLLAKHFLDRFSRKMNKRFGVIEAEAMDLLVRADWPGNVRELANALERAMVVGEPPVVRVEDLPFCEHHRASLAVGRSLSDMEAGHIAAILAESEWNISQAARVLGIDRTTLYAKIRKYGLRG